MPSFMMPSKAPRRTKSAEWPARRAFACAAAPPREVCGAVYRGPRGASYFQRLNQSEKDSRGQDDETYYLCLRKCATQKRASV
ncbi:unnamed protein product [Effrenium voratum]|uniref:Uncharacterized protein n=1 Tax=Effrenium voratum TaxID=2562239 RepID=A0AA36HL45_9DINO|nr:unnamed protein product [Effrenium voratum]CAJ1435213.1 unnamed protein product [Effrenium voratum]